MSSQRQIITHPKIPMTPIKHSKKSLMRGRKIENDSVFDNKGFQDENGHQHDEYEQNNLSTQIQSGPNEFTSMKDKSVPNKISNPIDALELKQKDTNTRSGSRPVRMLPDPHKAVKRDQGEPLGVPQEKVQNDSFKRVNSARWQIIGDRFRATRPNLTIDIIQRGFMQDGDLPFSRSQSLRIPVRNKPRRRLLRELSLADSDEIVIKDYGALGKVKLPRRQSESDLPNESSVRILLTTMQELLNRGKIYRVVVIDLDSCSPLASLPDIEKLSQSDANGMVKSFTCSPTIFKLDVSGDVYSCFKHSSISVQGRRGDVVLVMQKTNTCLVAAFSHEDSPGACQSEVAEFSSILERADW